MPCLHCWDIIPGTDGTQMECSRCGTVAATPHDVLVHVRSGKPLPRQAEDTSDVYTSIAFVTGIKRDDVKRVIHAFNWSGGDAKV